MRSCRQQVSISLVEPKKAKGLNGALETISLCRGAGPEKGKRFVIHSVRVDRTASSKLLSSKQARVSTSRAFLSSAGRRIFLGWFIS